MKKENVVFETLQVLGYKDLKNFYEFNELQNVNLDSHTRRILDNISPDAVLFINDKPFIVFYYSVNGTLDYKSIWNSQIPYVFSFDKNSLVVYNGYNYLLENKKLQIFEQIDLKEELIKDSRLTYWDLTDKNIINNYEKEMKGTRLYDSLLENLKFVSDELHNKYNITFGTKLILRIIFIRYLIDRGFKLDNQGLNSNNIQENREIFQNIVGNKEKLYKLFKYLKEKFNGNLFEIDYELNSDYLTENVFSLLQDFVSGEIKLKSGQYSLFPLYDFNIISVELISHIYETLLGIELQSKQNAYYTPSYLVDYSITTSNISAEKSHKVLDPACGSGIFLVKAYRSIIETKYHKDIENIPDHELINELEENIYGVDSSDEAIDVTIFSLYLTLLDYKNPKTLNNLKLPNLKKKNLIVDDFLSPDLEINNMKFDFIYSNPPWGAGTYFSNNKQKKSPQISIIFTQKILSQHIKSDTHVTLILPSKILYNNRDVFVEFRKSLLKSVKINEILDLSPIRKKVFHNAKQAPFVISLESGSKNSSKNLNNYFDQITLKPNIYFENYNILAIEKNDRKTIQQLKLFNFDYYWKILLYGSSWDLEIINSLLKNYKSINEVIEDINSKYDKEQIISGTGIQINGGDQNDSTEYLGMPLVNSNSGINKFIMNHSDDQEFTNESIHRTRNKDLFTKGPKALFRKGLHKDDFSIKAAYSEDAFLVRDTVTTVKATEEYKIFIKSLVGLLNSSLYSYLNVLLTSSVGVEREQILIEELFKYPFFDSKDKMIKVASYVDKIHNLDRKLIVDEDYVYNEILDELNSYILECFNLSDNIYVDYTFDVTIPTIITEQQDYNHVDETTMTTYAETFNRYFNDMFADTGYKVGYAFELNFNNQFSIFKLTIDNINQEYSTKIEYDELESLDLSSKFSVSSITDSFFLINDLITFTDNSLYIVKRNFKRNWHAAIANKDLSEVVNLMLGGD